MLILAIVNNYDYSVAKDRMWIIRGSPRLLAQLQSLIVSDKNTLQITEVAPAIRHFALYRGSTEFKR